MVLADAILGASVAVQKGKVSAVNQDAVVNASRVSLKAAMTSSARLAMLALICLAMTGCGIQKITASRPQEARLEGDRYQISRKLAIYGTLNAQEWTLYRAAELTRENHFDYFQIESSSHVDELEHRPAGSFSTGSGVHNRGYTPPMDIFHCSASMTFKMLKGRRPAENPDARDANGPWIQKMLEDHKARPHTAHGPGATVQAPQ